MSAFLRGRKGLLNLKDEVGEIAHPRTMHFFAIGEVEAWVEWGMKCNR